MVHTAAVSWRVTLIVMVTGVCNVTDAGRAEISEVSRKLLPPAQTDVSYAELFAKWCVLNNLNQWSESELV